LQDSQGKPASAPSAGAQLTDNPELEEVRAAWPSLSESERAAVLAIIRKERK
jgi:hypothetical protein